MFQDGRFETFLGLGWVFMLSRRISAVALVLLRVCPDWVIAVESDPLLDEFDVVDASHPVECRVGGDAAPVTVGAVEDCGAKDGAVALREGVDGQDLLGWAALGLGLALGDPFGVGHGLSGLAFG